jgi:hypothetical protein
MLLGNSGRDAEKANDCGIVQRESIMGPRLGPEGHGQMRLLVKLQLKCVRVQQFG